MSRTLTKSSFTVGLLIMLLAVPALGATVNKSIKIAANTESSGATSVNGSISVGENAVVTGNVRTVNGTIRVDSGAKIEQASTVNGGIRIAAKARTESLETVNGSIKVAEDVAVSGGIHAVNGRIVVEENSSIDNEVGNVNGQIELSRAEVGGNLETVNGDITIDNESVVKGDVIVKKENTWGWGKSKNRKPRIVIGPRSRVVGAIILEREVELYISESAEVGGIEGEMTMDDAVRFSGDYP